MKKLVFLLIQTLILVYLTGCASSSASSEMWEGISGNTLKVTISEFFPFEDDATNDTIKLQIKERLNQRASLIIASHITINLARNKISHEVDITLNKLINETITGGKMINFDCNENNYCAAHGEYDITELQKNLESINNQ